MGIKHTGISIFAIVALGLAAMACGLSPFGPSATPTSPIPPQPGISTLWPDVPVYPDSSPDLKTNWAINSFMPNQFGMIYHTDKKPADVVAYYTNDLFAKQGWKPQSYAIVSQFSVGHGQGPQVSTDSTDGGCLLVAEKNPPAAVCSFSKSDDQGKEIGLIISVSFDSKTNSYMLTYMRGSAAAKK